MGVEVLHIEIPKHWYEDAGERKTAEWISNLIVERLKEGKSTLKIDVTLNAEVRDIED